MLKVRLGRVKEGSQKAENSQVSVNKKQTRAKKNIKEK